MFGRLFDCLVIALRKKVSLIREKVQSDAIRKMQCQVCEYDVGERAVKGLSFKKKRGVRSRDKFETPKVLPKKTATVQKALMKLESCV